MPALGARGDSVRVVGSQRVRPRLTNKTLKANLCIAILNMRGGGLAATRDKWQHLNQVMRGRKIGVLGVQDIDIMLSTMTATCLAYHLSLLCVPYFIILLSNTLPLSHGIY